jgi:aminopeptidase-like protein
VRYKRSRRGDTEIDAAAEAVLRHLRGAGTTDWSPYGGDERQFCSPGFDLPVGAFSRTPADEFPEYHSSADDLDLVRPQALGDSLHAALRVIDVIERNAVYVNTSPYGEPQLGRRGLYRSLGGGSSEEAAVLWVLSLSDGGASLVDIALRAGLPFHSISSAADALVAAGLLRPLEGAGQPGNGL